MARPAVEFAALGPSDLEVNDEKRDHEKARAADNKAA